MLRWLASEYLPAPEYLPAAVVFLRASVLGLSWTWLDVGLVRFLLSLELA